MKTSSEAYGENNFHFDQLSKRYINKTLTATLTNYDNGELYYLSPITMTFSGTGRNGTFSYIKTDHQVFGDFKIISFYHTYLGFNMEFLNLNCQNFDPQRWPKKIEIHSINGAFLPNPSKPLIHYTGTLDNEYGHWEISFQQLY